MRGVRSTPIGTPPCSNSESHIKKVAQNVRGPGSPLFHILVDARQLEPPAPGHRQGGMDRRRGHEAR
jgi:hypothetical protein